MHFIKNGAQTGVKNDKCVTMNPKQESYICSDSYGWVADFWNLME